MPSTGADFFLIDRIVLDAFSRFTENNASIHAILCSMGFRQASILYTKEARLHGSSGWTFAKKLKLVVDSVTAFNLCAHSLDDLRRIYHRLAGVHVRGGHRQQLLARTPGAGLGARSWWRCSSFTAPR